MAMSFLAGVSLIFAGIANLVAGFLGLFPGMFEAAVAESHSTGGNTVSPLALLSTRYGRYALAHLAGAGLQIVGGSWFSWLTRSSGPVVHSLGVLVFVSLALELWGWLLKGSLSPFSIPGLAAAVLTVTVYGRLLRARAA